MVKRKFRIVKRENNIPVLGVCEYCNAEFTADPETMGRPQDAHAFIQKQFIAHDCNQPGAGQNTVRIMGEGAEIARWLKTTACGWVRPESSGTAPSATPAILVSPMK
jgi:hypothetical protein